MVASFPPVLLMRRNIIRKRLAEAGATTPEKALTLAEAGVINLMDDQALSNSWLRQITCRLNSKLLIKG